MPNPQTLSSVFCDDGAAPPPSVVLAAQTDLRADAVCVSLAAYENLSQYQQRSGGGVVRTPRDHLHRHVPYRVPSNGARERQDTPPATAPQDVPQTEVPVHEIPPMPPQAQIEHAREHVATETTASAEKPTDIVQIMEPGEFAHHPLIQKPRGYAGRSGSGGYNVQDAMGWNDDRFAVLKVA